MAHVAEVAEVGKFVELAEGVIGEALVTLWKVDRPQSLYDSYLKQRDWCGNPPGAGKIWEIQIFTEKMGSGAMQNITLFSDKH